MSRSLLRRSIPNGARRKCSSTGSPSSPTAPLSTRPGRRLCSEKGVLPLGEKKEGWRDDKPPPPRYDRNVLSARECRRREQRPSREQRKAKPGGISWSHPFLTRRVDSPGPEDWRDPTYLCRCHDKSQPTLTI